MPYCKSAISITKEMNVRETLDLLPQMKFGALHAVQCEWNHNQYSGQWHEQYSCGSRFWEKPYLIPLSLP